MKFSHRCYSTHFFRPTPEIIVDEQHQLLLVVTPWGPRQAAKKAAHIIRDYYLASKMDQEVTSPFEHLPSLSLQANYLRTGVLLANSSLYREDNRDEFLVGAEILALALHKGEISWSILGQPHLLVRKVDGLLFHLGGQMDAAYDFSRNHEIGAPLPGQLLGLESNCNLLSGHFKHGSGDQIALLARSYIPPTLQGLVGDFSLEEISRLLILDHASLPFWLGILKLSSEQRRQSAAR